MAKSNDDTAPEKSGAPNGARPSKLVIEALGEHADEQGLVQGEDEEEIAFAVRCIEKLGQLVTAMDGSIRKLEAEAAAVNRRLAAQRGATTKARARIVELEEADKPRALGPLGAVFDDEAEAFTAEDLMTAIDGAAEIVLAFSDGKAELKGIKPRKVRAEAFRLTRGRVLFTDEPLLVVGPGGEDTVTPLAGVALLLDGEQAAWSPMAQPVNLGAGQTANIAGSVIFG